jgi:hypothetical protein
MFQPAQMQKTLSSFFREIARCSISATLFLGTSCLGTTPLPNGEVLQAYVPQIPEIIFLAQKELEVEVDATVNGEGEVVQACVKIPDEESDVLLDYLRTHETFARQWRFRPTGREYATDIHYSYRILPDDAAVYEVGGLFIYPRTIILQAPRAPVTEWIGEAPTVLIPNKRD